MQRHSGTSARGESAKLKPEKAHTLTHTLTHDDNRCVCFVCNCNFRARFSFVVFVVVVVVDGGAKQTFSFLLRYRFEYVECVCLYVSMCVYVVCVLVYRIYFFLCYFPRFCFVISFTFSRRSYWEGIILSVSRCATLLIHKSCRPSRRRRRRRRLFESAKNFSSNRSHVWVAWLTIADWRANRWNDHLFGANMFDASECNLVLQSCCMLNSERA